MYFQLILIHFFVLEAYCEKRWLCIVYRMYDEVIWMIKYEKDSPWLLFPQLDFLEQFVFNELELCSDVSCHPICIPVHKRPSS